MCQELSTTSLKNNMKAFSGIEYEERGDAEVISES
jgi:hypothetical protein